MQTVLQLFPKSVEERLKAVLLNVNTEAKSMVLLYGLDRRDYRTEWDIFKKLGEVFREGLIPRSHNFPAYCRLNVKIGAVEEAGISKHVSFKHKEQIVPHYRITEDGEKYFKPAALFLFNYASKHGRSVYEYFGRSSSPSESRAPYNRLRVLDFIHSSYLTGSEIAKKLRVSRSCVKRHVDELSKLGFVEISRTSSDHMGKFKYRWVAGTRLEGLKSTPSRPALTIKVAKNLKSLKEEGLTQLAGIIKEKNIAHVSVVLSDLSRQGAVVKAGRFKLTEDGEEFYESCCVRLRNAMADGPELGRMQELLGDLYDLKTVNAFEEGIERYSLIGPGFKRQSPAKRTRQLSEFVKGFHELNGEWPRCRDIARADPVLKNYLNVGLKSGVVRRIRDDKGKTVRYAIPPATLEKTEVLQ